MPATKKAKPNERSTSRGPAPVDSHVGARIRIRRKLLGLSQSRLAEALNLTFQQVQKYERGTNRVSASKLYDIARFLQVPIAYFFEGLADPLSPDADPGMDDRDRRLVDDFLMTPEGLALADAFPKIGQARVRRGLLELARAAADMETVEFAKSA